MGARKGESALLLPLCLMLVSAAVSLWSAKHAVTAADMAAWEERQAQAEEISRWWTDARRFATQGAFATSFYLEDMNGRAYLVTQSAADSSYSMKLDDPSLGAYAYCGDGNYGFFSSGGSISASGSYASYTAGDGSYGILAALDSASTSSSSAFGNSYPMITDAFVVDTGTRAEHYYCPYPLYAYPSDETEYYVNSYGRYSSNNAGTLTEIYLADDLALGFGHITNNSVHNYSGTSTQYYTTSSAQKFLSGSVSAGVPYADDASYADDSYAYSESVDLSGYILSDYDTHYYTLDGIDYGFADDYTASVDFTLTAMTADDSFASYGSGYSDSARGYWHTGLTGTLNLGYNPDYLIGNLIGIESFPVPKYYADIATVYVVNETVTDTSQTSYTYTVRTKHATSVFSPVYAFIIWGRKEE